MLEFLTASCSPKTQDDTATNHLGIAPSNHEDELPIYLVLWLVQIKLAVGYLHYGLSFTKCLGYEAWRSDWWKGCNWSQFMCNGVFLGKSLSFILTFHHQEITRKYPVLQNIISKSVLLSNLLSHFLQSHLGFVKKTTKYILLLKLFSF